MERAKLKTEDWARVRFGAGTPWRRCWCVITPPDEKEYQKYQKQARKRSAYDRSLPPLKGDIKFYDTKKTKKATPIATITDAYCAYAIYPQSKDLINQSTLVKVEGTVTVPSQPSAPTTDGFVFVMPEVRPAVSGFEMMLRWLFPAFDTFGLYGRPGKLIADTLDTRGLMFAMPRDRRYGYLEILDVAGLIHTAGSQAWKEADWRRELKELTAKRISAMGTDIEPRQRSHSQSRPTDRNSLQLQSRVGALQSEDAPSTRSSSVRHQRAATLVGNTRGTSPPSVLSGPSGSSSSSAQRHQRSDSEARGMRRLQEQTSFDAPPPPPPHGIAVGTQDDPFVWNQSSHSNEASHSRSSSESDPQARESILPPLYDLTPADPPTPVVAPPAFIHAPGAKPPSKPYHSPELRQANNRMSQSTLSQMTAASPIALAGAAASWRSRPENSRDQRSGRDGRDVHGDGMVLSNGPHQAQEPRGYFAMGQTGVFPDASPSMLPANDGSLTEEGLTRAVAPGHLDRPLPSAPFNEPIFTESRPNENVPISSPPTSPRDKNLPSLNHELPRTPSDAGVSDKQPQLDPSQVSPSYSPGDRSQALQSMRHELSAVSLSQRINNSPLRESTPALDDTAERAAELPAPATGARLSREFIGNQTLAISRKPVFRQYGAPLGSVDNTPPSLDRRVSATSSFYSNDASGSPGTEFKHEVGKLGAAPANSGTVDSLPPTQSPGEGSHGRSHSSGILKSSKTEAASPSSKSHSSVNDEPRRNSYGPTGPNNPAHALPSRYRPRSPHINLLASGPGHNRSRSAESDMERRKSVPWQPGMAAAGAITDADGRALTPEQFVQQRAQQPRLTPLYAHHKNNSTNTFATDRPQSGSRPSTGHMPSGHGRAPSNEHLPRPRSRGGSAGYIPTMRPSSMGDYSAHLSAREQEHVARVTGSPLINLSGGRTRPQQQSGTLVGAIEARQRERQEIRDGVSGQMVQHAIMLRRQQDAQYQAQAQAQAHAQTQAHAQAQAQAQAEYQAQAQLQAQAFNQAYDQAYAQQQQVQQYGQPPVQQYNRMPSQSGPPMQMPPHQRTPSTSRMPGGWITPGAEYPQQYAQQYPQQQQPPYGSYQHNNAGQ